MGTLSRLASDLIVYSMPEFGFVSLGGAHSAGSSIMPQKKNPDGLELVRAKAAAVQADLSAIMGICCGLPSGYHRDLQETKRPLVHAAETTLACLQAMKEMVAEMHIDAEKMKAACSPEIFAADYATRRALAGTPFRQAYREVAQGLGAIEAEDAVANLKSKSSLGSPGNLGLKELQEELRGMLEASALEKKGFEEKLEALLEG